MKTCCSAMSPITVRIAGENEIFPGSFIVEQDGKYANGLGWDEMLGHFIALTLRVPSVRSRLTRNPPGMYGMMTQAEHDAWDRRRDQEDGA